MRHENQQQFFDFVLYLVTQILAEDVLMSHSSVPCRDSYTISAKSLRKM